MSLNTAGIRIATPWVNKCCNSNNSEMFPSAEYCKDEKDGVSTYVCCPRHFGRWLVERDTSLLIEKGPWRTRQILGRMRRHTPNSPSSTKQPLQSSYFCKEIFVLGCTDTSVTLVPLTYLLVLQKMYVLSWHLPRTLKSWSSLASLGIRCDMDWAALRNALV